jgi:hypothetical protein
MDQKALEQEIMYGPSLCPGCLSCAECKASRVRVVEQVRKLYAKIKQLERRAAQAAKE